MRVTGRSQKTTVFTFTAQGTPHRDSELSLTATSFLRNEIFMFECPSQIFDLFVAFLKDKLAAFIPLFSQLLTIHEYLYLLFPALISTPSPY